MKHVLNLLLVIVVLSVVGCTVEIPTPDVYETGINPDSWALVPAGEFLMGQWDDRSLQACTSINQFA